MSKKNLVICDGEYPYVNFLMENILEKKEPSVSVFICTSWEKVCELMESQKIHILLLDEKMCEGQEELKEIEKVVVLSHMRIVAERGDYPSVYKYQHVDRIMAEVFEEEGLFRSHRETEQKLLVVYTPCGKVGERAFALELGRELAKRRKTLYINLEAYPGEEILCGEEGLPNLGDLIYYLKQEHANLQLRLAAMVRQDERLDYLMPIPLVMDLREVSWEEWKTLFEWLRKESDYEVVVVDLGNCVQGLFELLQMCDKIYLPIPVGEAAERRVENFEHNLYLMNLSGLEKKLIKIRGEQGDGLNVAAVLTGEMS